MINFCRFNLKINAMNLRLLCLGNSCNIPGTLCVPWGVKATTIENVSETWHFRFRSIIYLPRLPPAERWKEIKGSSRARYSPTLLRTLASWRKFNTFRFSSGSIIPRIGHQQSFSSSSPSSQLGWCAFLNHTLENLTRKVGERTAASWWARPGAFRIFLEKVTKTGCR